MKVVDLKPANRQRTDAEKQSRKGRVSALEKLSAHAEKIILHMDGTHGIGRRPSSVEELVSRASSEVYLVLDLGHVLRLYFGDDYFDVILSSKIVQNRHPNVDALVVKIQEESAADARI